MAFFRSHLGRYELCTVREDNRTEKGGLTIPVLAPDLERSLPCLVRTGLVNVRVQCSDLLFAIFRFRKCLLEQNVSRSEYPPVYNRTVP